ncbi:hypothetical protein ABVB25_42480, partial [Streptomyces anthocyanicus]
MSPDDPARHQKGSPAGHQKGDRARHQEGARRLTPARVLDVDALLEDPHNRIVVCCGSGGVGKTQHHRHAPGAADLPRLRGGTGDVRG